MKTRFVIFTLSAVFGGCDGCHSARVRASFDVVCRGTPVFVEWDARSGSGVQLLDPAGAVVSTQTAGSAYFPVSTEGRFVLQWTGGSVSSSLIRLQTGSRVRTINVPTTCGPLSTGLLGLSGHAEPIEQAGPSIEIAAVSTHRSVATVQHLDRSFALLGGHPVTTPRGLSFAGQYSLESTLESYETCFSAPDNVTLWIETRCAP